MRYLTSMILMFLLLASSWSIAQGGGMQQGNAGRGPAMFETFDSNADGVISQEEFTQTTTARKQQRAEQGYPMKNAKNAPTFNQIDANGDGVVDRTEFMQHQQQRRSGKPGYY